MGGKALNYVEFQESAKLGLENARATLSAFTGRQLKLDAVSTDYVELSRVSLLSGSLEEVVLSSYVTFKGDAEGQIMMLFRPDSAEKLAEFMLPDVFGVARPENMAAMLNSLMLEVANVVGSSVLNKVADVAGMKLLPTPPVMIRDMTGAILSSAISYSSLDSNSIFVAYIKFSLADGKASFEVIFLPRLCGSKTSFLET